MQVNPPSQDGGRGAAQLRRNRSAGGRKAALFKSTARVRRAEAEPSRGGLYGPEGSHRGSTPAAEDIAVILARLRAGRSDPAGGG